ncbi:MAG: T9SS type A sorting domain-containing protein [Bacteroidales bacterium]
MIKLFVNTFLVIVLSAILTSAQKGGELLVDLETSPILKSEYAIKQSKAVLDLPFFDDFSRGKHSPVPELWSKGQDVFVNTSYSINSKTVGVATFDAINFKGQLHENASTVPFSADTLTSQNINLNFPEDTTIYITFYVQPQGLGYRPSPRDSLTLEFFDAENNQWVNAWAGWADFSENKFYNYDILHEKTQVIEAESMDSLFFMVHFPVRESRFLNADFKLRFRNYASLSSNNDVPGLRGNSDHWNVDLIYIDRGRAYDDTLLNDITFYKPLGSVLNNYESMPWKHFNQLARQEELSDPMGFTINYRNMGGTVWNITRRFSIYNHSNSNAYNFSGQADNIFEFEEIEYTRNYFYDFESAWPDSAKFTFTSYLETDINPETHHLRWNDTLSYTQQFKNYYAYDDGTAESGYGLYGEGVQNGMVAYRFTNYEPDWLVGVYMYFNRTQDDDNQHYFKLAIWDDNNGKPGSIIYEELGLRPEFTDSLNRFTLFQLEEELWIEDETYYVGWVQTNTSMLNVGFDRSNVNNQHLFYNIDGSWLNSQFEGSLMIRPVFGELTEPPTSAACETMERLNPKVYPNPAYQHFSIKGVESLRDVNVQVFTASGQQVINQTYTSNSIDISSLSSGVYIVRILAGAKLIGTQKLIVGR